MYPGFVLIRHGDAGHDGRSFYTQILRTRRHSIATQGPMGRGQGQFGGRVVSLCHRDARSELYLQTTLQFVTMLDLFFVCLFVLFF